MSSKEQNPEDIDKKSQDDRKSDTKKTGEEEEAGEEIGKLIQLNLSLISF